MVETGPGRQIDYFPWGNRLVLEAVDGDGQPVLPGETGQVRVTRLDESILIVRLPERDVASIVTRVPADAPEEFYLPGLRNPGPRQADAPKLADGLY